MTTEETPAPEVDQETFAQAWEEGATVLDVRNPDEHADKRIPGVVLIPLGELVERADEVPVPPAGQPLYVVCAAGARSMRAATWLRNERQVEAVNVAGGTNAWAEAGRPLETG